MIALAVLGLVAGQAMGDPSLPILREVRERTGKDTIHLDMVFEGSRPATARIGIDGPLPRTGNFLLEFEGARADRAALRALPSWLRNDARKDADRIRLVADLDARTPWRGRWDGNTLHLVLLDRVDRPSLLTNPWVLGAAGALALGGTALAWTALDDPSRDTPLAPPTEDVIPPPDIAFP